MDPAPSDLAERRIVIALPELDATARRGLALALAGVPRAGVASELGLAGAELSATMAAGRKALRRGRVQLPSAGRCERSERVLSDRLDGAAAASDERFLESHLARCRRCRTHERELAAAIEGLHAPPAALPAPPPRARLRVVPPAPQLPPAPEPARAAPPAPTLVAEVVVVADRPPPTPTEVAVRHDRSNPALPVAIAALIAAGLIAAAIALLMHFNSGDSHARAPWSKPGAPIVHPAPIRDQ